MFPKHAAKIQGVVPWTILRIFCPLMIFEKPICFEDIGETKFQIITFYYEKLHENSTQPTKTVENDHL